MTLSEEAQRLSSDPKAREEAERAIYYQRPPTGEEFLDPRNGWLSRQQADGIYPFVKEDFLALVDGTDSQKQQIVQYGCTRGGKTFTSRLMAFYTLVYIHHLRDPGRYYGLSTGTSLALYLVCFKYDKTRQLLLRDLIGLMRRSPRFRRFVFQRQVLEQQDKLGREYVAWSTASSAGAELTLASGLQVILSNDDPNELLGMDILQMHVCEISFFIKSAGATEEEIFELYAKGLRRIRGTVGRAGRLSFVYLDTSANNSQSTIERFILDELQGQPDVFFRWRNQWECRPYLFPIYNGDKDPSRKGETFQLIVGSGNIPAKIVESEKDLMGVPEDLIENVPIDAKNDFEMDLLGATNDIAGRPTVGRAKFISNFDVIERMFDRTLWNIEGGVVADAKAPAELLLWSAVVENLFAKYDGRTWRLKRSAKEPRVIGLDYAYSKAGDYLGAAMLHPEWSRGLNLVVWVTDFCFPIMPGENGINLQAVQEFVGDLRSLGGVDLRGAALDRFQSEQFRQNMERIGQKVFVQSVDKTVEPYSHLRHLLLGGKIKMGRNAYVKNNLDSLYSTSTKPGGPEKIDHSKARSTGSDKPKIARIYNGQWDRSDFGRHAKDASDALCQGAYLGHQLLSAYQPRSILEDEDIRAGKQRLVVIPGGLEATGTEGPAAAFGQRRVRTSLKFDAAAIYERLHGRGGLTLN